MVPRDQPSISYTLIDSYFNAENLPEKENYD
jgi:hypothetical protein